MERKFYDISKLKEFQGKQLSQERLLGRNYFYCLDGEVKVFSNSYTFPDLDSSTISDFGDDITEIRDSIAEDLNNEKINEHWIKCMPVNPEDCECEAYIVLCISVDDNFIVNYVTSFVWMNDYYNGMWEVTEEMIEELENLCNGTFLPDDFTFTGVKVTDELKSIFHLHNSGCDYSLHCMSGYRAVTTSFFIDVDNSDHITKISVVTNENGQMSVRPVSADDEYVDLMDGMLLMYDKL